VLKNRVIPSLLLLDGGLVKTTKFKDPKYVGDPINAIRIFNEKQVDELMVLDITASKEGREPNYALIEQFAGECFMPLAYGGGVRTLDQAKRIFSCGVEKICLQTSALSNPKLITELSDRFGSQSIVVSIDVKRNWLGTIQLYQTVTGKTISANWLDVLRQMVEAGAGEILLNAVDKDGTLSGPDLDIIQKASSLVEVPLISVGGISSLEDIRNAIISGASGVAAGAFFVYYGPHRAVLITYPKNEDLENILKADQK
jgi:imidazole glycerol-phosphate synthase subunit HisF